MTKLYTYSQILLLTLITAAAFAQSPNTFPASGNVGIGTTTPNYKLQVFENGRNYYVNRAILGNTEDTQGPNYLLLHKIYKDTLSPNRFVMGKITAIRGNAGEWNRKWTVEVNTSSAYNSNRGSIITYNEPASLVTLTYNGENYLAVVINNSSMLYGFSFTGYAANDALAIAYDDSVSNVLSFTALDPITIQGRVAIGTSSTGPHMLAVEGTIGARKVKVQQSAWADFVFQPDYKLPLLKDVESYIQQNRHLPGIPPEKEVMEEGIDVGEMNKKLLQKVEELTLYLIDQQKQIARLQKLYENQQLVISQL